MGAGAAWRRTAPGDYLAESFGAFVLISFGTGVVAVAVAGLPLEGGPGIHRGPGARRDRRRRAARAWAWA
jgi:hypothetical protein